MNPSRVSVVIPNYNGARLLEPLLNQLPLQSHSPAEVIVVDNGSTDPSRAIASKYGAKVLALDRNYGFAYAVNRGVEAAGNDLVAILNNDVELDPGWLAHLVNAVVAGSTFATGKTLMASRRDRIDGTFDLVSVSGCAWRAGHGAPDGPIWSEPRTIDIAPMTALLIRRHRYLEAGGLDERFGSYLEDVDFGLRCAAKGYSGSYIPSAVAYHVGSATRGPWHPLTVRQISRNQLLLVAKHVGRQGLRQSGVGIAVGQVLWGLLALRHGRILDWFRGKIEGLRMFQQFCLEGDHRAAPLFLRHEALIRELQGNRMDQFWRWYFRLTGRGRIPRS
ncbi:MAG TPA: glycosyltransferase family 2 protein [Bryobacteraceae bacterium]|nr:glycosyltransferase family 2 protein [Bryobacteraceae bacterium]